MATRCTTAEQFVETFHRYCDEQSFFVATMNMRPVGLETPFSIQLADKSPVLRGLCVVLAAYTTAANPYKRPGVRLGIRRLTADSEAVFYQLQAMRTAAPLEVATEASAAVEEPIKPTPPPTPPPTPQRAPMRVPDIPVRAAAPPPPPPAPDPVPEPIQDTVTITDAPPIADPTPVGRPFAFATTPPPIHAEPRVEERTPGSDLVLPANPLQNLTDESLEGFVDCTLYEETGNFFRADDDGTNLDDPAAPPVAALPPVRPSVVMAALDAARTSGETMPPPFVPAVPPPPQAVQGERAEPSVLARVERVETSVVASLARVEHSVSRLLDVVDTSRPIDEGERITPMPAGEAYARQVAKTQAKFRNKWLLLGGGAVFAIGLVVVLVLAMRSSKDAPVPAHQPSPPVAIRTEKPVEHTRDKQPSMDVPKVDVDGDEVAANENEPSTPAAGDGPCKLEVKTTPAGTMVSLDGQAVGPSPITIGGPCTKRRVDLEHPRYKTEMRWVTLKEGQPGSIDVTLVRPTHNLTILSNPAGATVYIAGRRAGTTPTKIPLMGFTGVDVTVEKFGFASATKRVYSKVPNDTLSIALKKQPFMK